MNSNALYFFGYLGVFNGLILSIYFFFFTAKKHLSAYLFGALLLMLTIRIWKSVAYFFDYNLSKTYLQIGLTACFFIGPFLYFFTKAETAQIRKIPRSWIQQILFCLIAILTVGAIFPYQSSAPVWGHYIIPAIYMQWGIYVAASLLLIIPVLKRITKKEPVKPHEKWVLAICALVSIIYACYIWSFFNLTKGSYINGAIWFSLAIYLVVFALLYRKKTNDLFFENTRKYIDKKLDQTEAERMIGRLQKAMIEKELFKNPNLKVNDLAKEINISGAQLSQLLNDNCEKSFTVFVNEYRINEACRILSENSNLTIEAIGEEVGFNSKSTFFATFKKIRGLTPSAFQQSMSTDL
ncbi:helix-turn-helix domain-containing protein [Pollutibacter soli]|uniref:helix-turn-helix domain-containing protein n=1 Tax=Pollutibacter soli TaxID=3034157 RepID=UPI003013CD68